MAKVEGHTELTLFDDHILASLSNCNLENRGDVILVSPIPFFISKGRPGSQPLLSRGERKKFVLVFFLDCLFYSN